MAITGIVMMAYADGFHGDSFMGVAFAVGSASTSALYKVSTVSFPAQQTQEFQEQTLKKLL